MNISKYFAIGKITFYNNLAYPLDFLASSLFIALIIFIFVNLWMIIYQGGERVIDGFTLTMMVWYLVLTESIVTSQGQLVDDIGKEIQSGAIAQKLNKPYNFVGFHYSSALSKSLFTFTLTFFFGSIVALAFVGPLQIPWYSIPLILLAIFIALSLHFLTMAFLAVFAFWLEDARALNFIYFKLVFVFGGMLLPLEFFPEWLAKIAEVLPFSYIAYHPAKLFVQFNFQQFLSVLAGQLIWLAIMIIAVIIAYSYCFKRISINGG